MICEWFLFCENPADGTVHHPFIGDVPTCNRCAEKLGLELVQPEPPEVCDTCGQTLTKS